MKTSTYKHDPSTKTPEQQANERAIQLKYGNDGEEHYLNWLRAKYPEYKWELFKNENAPNDILGRHKNRWTKEIISIEIKSKRYVREKNKYHSFNKSKLDWIKKKMNEGYIFRAYIVMNLLKEYQAPLTPYNFNNAGQFIIHEITPNKLAENVGKLEIAWDYIDKKSGKRVKEYADEYDEMYMETELKNEFRDIINYGIQIENDFWEDHNGFVFPKVVKVWKRDIGKKLKLCGHKWKSI